MSHFSRWIINMFATRVFSNSIRKSACRTRIIDPPGKVRHHVTVWIKGVAFWIIFFKLIVHEPRCCTLISSSYHPSVWTVIDRPFWPAYLADIFAEVHLTFSMNYFPLEATPFCFPFSSRYCWNWIRNFSPRNLCYHILNLRNLPVHKRFEMIWVELFRQYLEEKKWLEVVMLGHILEMDLIEDIEQSLLLALRCLKFA